MNSKSIKEFEKNHQVTIPNWWQHGNSALNILLQTREGSLAKLNTKMDILARSEPSFGLLLHMLERIYELVASSIICFATKQGSSAEITSRVAIESSVNIQFILKSGRDSYVVMWLKDFIETDKRQIINWEKSLETLSDVSRNEHKLRIDKRKRLSVSRENFVQRIQDEISSIVPLDPNAKWPSIKDRFEKIGELATYRTVYARLSSQTHADAEDSINYMLSMLCSDRELSKRIALETIAHSEYMLFLGILYYSSAWAIFLTCFGLTPADDFQQTNGELHRCLDEIAKPWEW